MSRYRISEQTFSPRRHSNSQQVLARVFISNHQGNANQNHNEMSPHICQNGYQQEDKRNIWGGEGKRKYLCTVVWIVNWYSHHGNHYEDTSKKLNVELPCDPGAPLLGMFPKEMKTGYQKDICTSMFTVSYSLQIHLAVIHNSQDSERLEFLWTDKWTRETYCRYITE